MKLFKFTLVALLSLAWAGSPVQADENDMPAPEQALETGTNSAKVPTTVGSAIVTRRCQTCPTLTLRLVDTSKFFVGKEQITLAQLQRFIGTLSGRDRRMTVFYDTRSHHINRLVVAGELR